MNITRQRIFCMLSVVVSLVIVQFSATAYAGPQEMKCLGEVDFKVFFFDNTTARTWNDAWMHCRSKRMWPASFENRTEADLVVGALKKLMGGANLTEAWTQASNKPGPEGYHWTNTRTELQHDVITFSGTNDFACVKLAVRPGAVPEGILFSTWCTDPVEGVICHEIRAEDSDPRC